MRDYAIVKEADEIECEFRLTRRMKVVCITPAAIGAMATGVPGGSLKSKSDIPPDATLARVAYDPIYDVFRLVYIHPSFPIVKEGHAVPQAATLVISWVPDPKEPPCPST